MSDFFDTQYEGKKIEIDDGLVHLGQEIDLLAKDPTLKNVLVGAGWDINVFSGAILDMDLSLILLNKNGMTRVDEDFVFYNQPETLGGGIKHYGDSRSGAGDGDDEVIGINLHAVTFDIIKILIVVSIYKGYEREQHLSQIRNGYVRIANADTLHEVCRFQIDKVMEEREETAVVIAELEREGPKWNFKPTADFVAGGLGALAKRYGLMINQE
jgi:tellurium resistance protein TerD